MDSWFASGLFELFFLFDFRPFALRRQFSLVLPFLSGGRTIMALAFFKPLL
jgi:hypothetical protein